MPDRSKVRGYKKCIHWSFRLGVGRGANDPIPEKFTVTKPPEKPWKACNASKEEKEEYTK
jgi:hypothetical protein